MPKTGRQEAEYNKKSAERVKIVYTEQGITQNKLAEIINIQQSAISEMVHGKRKVTATTAQAIHSAFPQYSVSYLLGIDDNKNDAEKNIALINQAQKEGALLEAGLRFYASLKGFDISSPYERMPDRGQADEMLKHLKDGYLVTSKNGETCALSVKEMNQLENDVCDYVEYRLNRWIKKGR